MIGAIVDLRVEYAHPDVRGIVLDVAVDGRERCRLRGVVSEEDLRRWKQDEIGEPQFVTLVARCTGERLRSEVVVDPDTLSVGGCRTVPCGTYLDRVFESLVMPMSGCGGPELRHELNVAQAGSAQEGVFRRPLVPLTARWALDLVVLENRQPVRLLVEFDIGRDLVIVDGTVDHHPRWPAP